MLELRYTLNKILLPMSATKRYMPETLEASMRIKRKPWFVRVAGRDVPILTDDQLNIACKMVAEDHNELSSAPIDDGWDEDTRRLEEQHEYFLLMESSSSGSANDSDPHSEDDLVYERFAYT